MRYKGVPFLRESNRGLNFICSGIVLAVAGWLMVNGCEPAARAADVVPFFKPDHPKLVEQVPYGPPEQHPIATECALPDDACVAEHDARVLESALGLVPGGKREDCERATRPVVCREEVDMIRGDVQLDDSVLMDPCAWVVRVDRGVATLYSRKLMATRQVANRGWRAAQFIGACDVSKVGPAEADSDALAGELPAFPWRAQ